MCLLDLTEGGHLLACVSVVRLTLFHKQFIEMPVEPRLIFGAWSFPVTRYTCLDSAWLSLPNVQLKLLQPPEAAEARRGEMKAKCNFPAVNCVWFRLSFLIIKAAIHQKAAT